MSARDCEVAVVGAGPCGLLTALLLARRGIKVFVFERKSELLNHPKAMGISRRTAEIFAQAGLRDAMMQADLAPPEYSLAIWAESLVGEEYGRVPLQPADPSVAPYPAFHCPQTITERVLLDAVEREECAGVLFGHEVESFDDTGEGVRLTVRGNDATAGIACRYLVAADGAGSPIRHALGIEGIGPGDLGHFLNTFFRAPYGPHMNGRRAILHNLLRQDLFEIFVAVNGDDLWLMHHFLQPGEQAADYSPERLAGMIREASRLPDIPVEVLSVTQWVMSPKIAARFREGNVFLTGDASARLSPAAGLGMNTGLQSAHNLAWKLAAVLRGAPAALLDTYDSERRGHVMRTFEMSNDFGSEVWEILEAGLGGNFDRVRDLVANSRRAGSGLGIDLGWRYAKGAFVSGENSQPATPGDVNEYVPTAEPGRRAPHVWIEQDGRRISTIDLFGSGFVLLAAGNAAAWRAAASAVDLPGGGKIDVVQIGGEGGCADVENRFPSIHGLQPGGAVLVRPDGVVGWRSADCRPEALQPALESILAGG